MLLAWMDNVIIRRDDDDDYNVVSRVPLYIHIYTSEGYAEKGILYSPIYAKKDVSEKFERF